MVQSLIKKSENNFTNTNTLWFHGVFCVLFLVPWYAFSQWNPANNLIPAPGDCPIAYRICDATQTYNFELLNTGSIDDANGSLNIPGLNKSTPTQFESKSCFIVFTPQYSGQFGLSVCPESVEDLAFILFENPDCGDLQTGNYSIVTESGSIQSPTDACTGIGLNPYTGTQPGDYYPYINVSRGITYVLFTSVEWHTQPGTHKFTLSFQGDVVTAHPDLFDHPECRMATQNFTQNNTNVYPNPFTNSLHIAGETHFTTLALHDMLGKEILKQPFVNQINTANLAKGMYLLRLTTHDGEVVVKKVVKE